MNPAGVLSAALGAALLAGCATASHRTVTSEPPTSAVEWPTPLTGDAAVAALNRMPATLGQWDRAGSSRGTVLYEHPRGQLGIEGSDLEDLYADDVDAAEALDRLGADLDAGTARSCSHPPYRCLLGEQEGKPTMIWSDDRSEVVLVAVWPDDESGALLADAWADAQR